MEINKFFLGKNEVVLTPDDFKEFMTSVRPDLLDEYDIEKTFFAECYEKELAYYPLVVMKLSAKKAQQTDYACYVPSTGKLQIWFGKMSYRVLDCHDVAHKMSLLAGKQILDGKIVMTAGGLGFRFRAIS